MAELLVPDSDIVAGGWTTNAGGTSNLFQGIDETGSVNLADYVQSALNPVNDIYEFTFTNPSAILTSGVINLQIGKKNDNAVVVNLKFQLLQGTTLIREQLFSDIPFTPVLQQVTLTAPEIAAITDATLLRGKLIANPTSSNRRYWRVEFGPAVSATNFLDIIEIQMRIGGVDQTSPAAAAASVTSSIPLGQGGSFPDDQAFDNVLTVRWVTNYNSNGDWIQWDFGVDTDLDDVTILTNGENESPVSVMIKHSADGVSFTTVHTTSGLVFADWTAHKGSGGTPKVFTI